MGKYTKYLMSTLYLGVIAVMIFSVVLIISGIKTYITDSNNKFTIDKVPFVLSAIALSLTL